MLVRLQGKVVRCHCPTTGRLGDLELAGLPCLLSPAEGGKRKTAYTVEAIATAKDFPESWVGINQTAANRYVEFFIRNGALKRMVHGELRREVRLGQSRIDFLVGKTYVEVKTPLVTLPSANSVPKVKHSRFDSFDRLIRHMSELKRSLSGGQEAVIVLCYLYNARPFRPPARDQTNSKILTAAADAERAGVERWQVNLRIDCEGVSLIRYFRSRPYRATTAM
jgi:sugar fermentation stimulation protein A